MKQFEFEKLKNGNYEVVKYLGNSKKVIIPETYLSKKVTHIRDGAFCCNNIVDLVIPHSVKYIGNYAFCCTNIVNVVIPHSVTHIGDCVFDGCKLLKKVVIENNFKTYYSRHFEVCNNLKEIVFKGKKYSFEIIDNISMLVSNIKKTNGYTIKKCLYLHNQKECYVVSAEGYNAHSDKLKQAIESLQEKIRKNESKMDLS